MSSLKLLLRTCRATKAHQFWSRTPGQAQALQASPTAGAGSAGISNDARVVIHMLAALQSTNFNDT
jgi:hypothetical protein